MANDFASVFIEQCVCRIEEQTPRIEMCLGELTEEEVWARPNDASNSAGNLVLHLCGNIRQYAISSLGGKEDVRIRDAEFAARGGMSKHELLNLLTSTVNEAVATIRGTNEAELLRVRAVQGFQLSGIGIIIHVTEHYSYHTGQIAFWTKLLKQKDLGFYANMDLNVANKD